MQAGDMRIQYDSQAAALVGRRLRAVRYWGLPSFGGQAPAWDYGDWHHAVMGVELLTDQGPACVLWSSTFYSHGVEVFQTPISQHIAVGDVACESWDASRSDRWQAALRSPVTGLQTFWEPFHIGGGAAGSDSYTVQVPVALRIDCDAETVWMVAGIPQAPEMKEVFVGGDEIMVVFTNEKMRQIGFPDSEFLATERG